MSIALIYFSDTRYARAEELSENIQSRNVIKKSKKNILRWHLKSGDILEIRKESRQKIKLGNQAVNRFILHRIVLEVKRLNTAKGYFLRGEFTSRFKKNKADTNLYQAEKNYNSSFFLEPRGIYHIPQGNFMPNIRNIPTFPKNRDPSNKTLKVGDTWVATAEELMNTGVIIRIPLQVEYEYNGSRTVDTNDGIKTLHSIIANYRINYKVSSANLATLENVPKKLFGFATAKFLWDEIEGIPYFSAEEYNLIVVYANGRTQEFDIRSKTFYKKIKKISKKKKKAIAQAISSAFESLQGPGPKPTLKKNSRGLTIELPDLLFDFNSANLNNKSEQLLDRISRILEKHNIHRIEVVGHTDSTGSDKYNEVLSKNRAKSVAQYLVGESESLKKDQIAYKGLGSSRPAYSNQTVAGRKKNRRVEIILLDK